MKRYLFKWYLIFAFCGVSKLMLAQSQNVSIAKDADGFKLKVDQKDFIINGMNWDYYPIGTNYNYSLWKEKDEIIQKALDQEMSLLKNMGVNAIRLYRGVPSKWISYIFKNYGIYTIINDSFGRYGLTVNKVWKANTNYGDAATQALLLSEAESLVKEYQDTPGILLYLLGNENNYGLFWEGAETENIPLAERKSTQKAYEMYKLFDKAALKIKSMDKNHPVAMCNGDLLFLDIIKEECKNVDIFGTNMYRGASFGDAFQKVQTTLNKPLLFTEFGSDAYNEISQREDQEAQAKYLVSNWKEIYKNVSGQKGAQNCIGGCTFQFSDGWWKYNQTANLEEHDTNASWANGGYTFDFKEGDNNMNEEWFGICGKGNPDENGLYTLYPRAAYYALQKLHLSNLDVVGKANNQPKLEEINALDDVLKARGDQAILNQENSKFIQLSRFTADINTFQTGGSLLTTPKNPIANDNTYPNKQGFDHMESYYVGIKVNPSNNMTANVDFNILGHVATNPINEIFYENRGRPFQVTAADGTLRTIEDNNRFQVYKASYTWDSKYFKINGFYRTGHYHWGYEGDFFGLYPEANYGDKIDLYNGEAPMGMEISGKKKLEGFKLAYGPQLWWGANPAFLLKYRTKLGKGFITGLYHEDIDKLSSSVSSLAIPSPKTRRVTLALEQKIGAIGLQMGGIWAGQPLIGRTFQLERNGVVYQDQINSKDNFGGKMKVQYTSAIFNAYLQGAYMGLVANGGADWTQTFTGWSLKDSGSGNQYNVLSGFTYQIGNFQIAPNFLWQKPIEAAITPNNQTGARARNILDDPFVVRQNRQMTAGELLITYDPTPSTWMYNWDNDRTEDAHFALSAGVVYKHLPTQQDAAIGILPDGRSLFAFASSTIAHDLWEAKTRLVSKWSKDFGLIANIYAGTNQANGSDSRLIKRVGMDLRIIYKKIKFENFAKFNDWGPYDYHKDYNLTFPFQAMADISTQIGKPDWFLLPSTKIGIRASYRTLNKYSPRYNPTQSVNAKGDFVPDPLAIGFPNGNEWELRTYIQINIGK